MTTLSNETEAHLRAEVEKNTAPFRDHDIAGQCKKLRRWKRQLMPARVNPDGPPAADTLERQAAEIKKLREALEKISKGGPDTNRPPRPKYTDGFDEGCAWAGRIARAALTGEDA